MNHYVICKKINFDLEEEIKDIFRNNLSNIFPHITFVDDEYVPLHAKGSRIDHVLLHNENSKFILVEYKKRQGRDPINQILNYRRLLSQKEANFYVFRDLFLEITKTSLTKTGIWGKFTEDWWKNNLILVCIAPVNFFSRDQIGVSEERNIILLEAQKYKEDIYNIVFLRKEDKNLLGSSFQSIVMIKEDVCRKKMDGINGIEKLNVKSQQINEDKIEKENSLEKIKKWAEKEANYVINLDADNLYYDKKINRYDVWDKRKKKVILTIYFYDMRHRKVLPKIFLVNPSQKLKEQYKNKLVFKTKWESNNVELDESYQYVINDNFQEARELLLEFIKESKGK